MTNEAQRDEHARATIAAFLLRARRVEAHSLAQDPAALLRLARMEIDVRVDATTGAATMTQQFPPEEQVESAAARLRSLFLNDDPTYYGKFLRALGYLLHSAAAPRPVMEELDRFRKAWATVEPRGRDIRGYSIQVSTAGAPATDQIADNVLGFAWIYGDVVHSDADRLAETRTFGVRERFRAAVPLVANIMGLAIGTLNFTRQLRQHGLIDIDDDVFDTPVVVTDTTFHQEARIYLGDPHTADGPIDIPPIGEEPGAGWTPIHQVFTGNTASAADGATSTDSDTSVPPDESEPPDREAT